MEVELKYTIHNKEISQQLWEEEDFELFGKPENREIVFMKAVYFDTADYALAKNDMAYRIRAEGDKLIACLKWGGKTEGALHTREEINVPVKSREPDPATFGESDIGGNLTDLIDGKPLSCIMEMKIERRRFRLDTEKSILEISIDCGDIVTENGTCPVCEIEIELFSGEREEMMEIGRKLQEKYGLHSEKRSKFYRGLMIAGQRS